MKSFRPIAPDTLNHLLDATAVIQRALGAAGLRPAGAGSRHTAPGAGCRALRDIDGVRLPAEAPASSEAAAGCAPVVPAAPTALPAANDPLAAMRASLAHLPGLAGLADTLAGFVSPPAGGADSLPPLDWQAFMPTVPGRPASPEPDAPLPDGACFLEGVYTGAAGSQSYKLYVPASLPAGEARPLLVMLHGCTQDADDFAAGTRMNALAEEARCFVLYPVQAQGANLSKCWNWFRAEDQQRDQGEPALLAGLTRWILATYPVDARRVYVAGLSAGGAMAAILGTTHPDLYAAIGVHSGLAPGSAHDLLSAFTAMQGKGTPDSHTGRRSVPTIIFHGDRDATVHPRNGDQVMAHGTGRAANDDGDPSVATAASRGGRVAGGHAWTCTVQHDDEGRTRLEHWLIHGAGHAWAGGSARGSYTDPAGPDASREMLRFFAQHSL